MKIEKLIVLILLLSILSCGSDSSSSSSLSSSSSSVVVTEIDSDGSKSVSDESDDVISVDMDSDLDYKVVEITHDGSSELNLAITTSEERDIYFIFSNINKSSGEYTPDISDSIDSNDDNSGDSKETPELSDEHLRVKDKEKVFEFNENPFDFVSNEPLNRSLVSYSTTETSYSEGDTLDFNDADKNEIPATLRKIVNTDNANLYIWVEDDSWTDNDGDVTQTMVDGLSDKFLLDGSNNDIYDWVTNVVGEQWGEHNYSTLIDDTDDIHILIMDIDSDGTSGGVLGYYFSRDNILNEYFDYSDTYGDSNEKIMFYIDSAFLATSEGSSWDITDEYPQEIVSTLAHEFQHMINFYQKTVKNELDSSCETWLNELCSMAIEDLVANKIEADGPRGVDYDDGTAGSEDNTSGRLPLYNYYNEISLTNWQSNTKNYAINYAFGAYLIRNFGGAEFLQALVQNDEVGYQAVTDALSELGYSDYDFDSVFRRFAAANLLSEFEDTVDTMNFNNGGWFTSTEGDTTYKLGSINLYNYLFESGGTSNSGPYIYETLPQNLNSTSNLYYQAGEDVNGVESFTLDELDSNVQVTVLIK